jgi:hypothetical protein
MRTTAAAASFALLTAWTLVSLTWHIATIERLSAELQHLRAQADGAASVAVEYDEALREIVSLKAAVTAVTAAAAADAVARTLAETRSGGGNEGGVEDQGGNGNVGGHKGGARGFDQGGNGVGGHKGGARGFDQGGNGNVGGHKGGARGFDIRVVIAATMPRLRHVRQKLLPSLARFASPSTDILISTSDPGLCDDFSSTVVDPATRDVGGRARELYTFNPKP